MKSEHRHELKTNDLAKSLLSAGDYVRIYGGRVALGLAIVILVIVLIVQRVNRSRNTQAALPGQIAQVRQVIDRLTNQQLNPKDREVTDPANGALAVLASVKDNASDNAVKAEALATEGDLQFTIATFPRDPAPPSLTTSRPAAPSVTDAERAEAAAAAKSAYSQILDKYADQTIPVITARFGLAALAENSHDWAGARAQYEAVKAIDAAPEFYKKMADGKLAYLERIQKPVLVGQVTEPETPKVAPEDIRLPDGIKPATSQSTTTTTKGATTKPVNAAPTVTPGTPATPKVGPTTRPTGPTTRPSGPTTRPTGPTTRPSAAPTK